MTTTNNSIPAMGLFYKGIHNLNTLIQITDNQKPSVLQRVSVVAIAILLAGSVFFSITHAMPVSVTLTLSVAILLSVAKVIQVMAKFFKLQSNNTIKNLAQAFKENDYTKVCNLFHQEIFRPETVKEIEQNKAVKKDNPSKIKPKIIKLLELENKKNIAGFVEGLIELYFVAALYQAKNIERAEPINKIFQFTAHPFYTHNYLIRLLRNSEALPLLKVD